MMTFNANTNFCLAAVLSWEFIRLWVPHAIGITSVDFWSSFRHLSHRSDYCRSRSFSHFYGPPKVDDNSDKQDESWIPLDNSKYDAGEAPESHMSDAGCEMNKKCAKLELVGYCCPTNHGVMLECCH
jgi:hypothetical protein